MNLRPLLLALAAVLVSAPAIARDADPRARELAVAAQAVERGMYLFALEPLKLLAEDRGFPARAEAVILLARTRIGLGELDAAAGTLSRFQERFPSSARHFLDAVYWSAVADLNRASLALPGSGERRNFLKGAVDGFRQVLDESIDPALLARARFNAGAAHYVAGGHRSALDALNQARQLGVLPENQLELEILLASAKLGLRDFSSALKDFAGYIDRHPDSRFTAEAFFGLGEAHYFLEEWPRAAENYRWALDNAVKRGDPALADRARYALAWALAKTGERQSPERERALAEAFEHFDRIILGGRASLEERETAAFQAARMLHLLGRHGESAERLLPLTGASRSPEGSAQALHLLGLSRQALGQYEAAIDSFERLLEMEDRVSSEIARRTRFALAETLVESGDSEAAGAVLRPMTGTDQPVSIRANALLQSAAIARFAARRADGARAAEHYAEAYRRYRGIAGDATIVVELSSDEIVYWTGRSAQDCAAYSDADARQAWLDRALEAYSSIRHGGARNSWVEKALLGIAYVHIDRSRPEDASRACRELIALPGVSSENELAGRITLARVEHDLGRHNFARDALAPVLERVDLSPGRQEAAYLTASAYLAEGNAPAALEGFRRVSGERAADALKGAADSLAAMGDMGRAAAEYERLILEYPDYAGIDGVRLAAGDARKGLGEMERAYSHYDAVYEKGTAAGLRALARLHQAHIVMSDNHERSLALLKDASELPVDDDLRARIAFATGEALSDLARHDESVAAFTAAADAGDMAMRLKAVVARAESLLAVDKEAGRLRMAARDLTWVVYYAPNDKLRRAARLRAAGVLVSLAEIEMSSGESRVAQAELREASALLREAAAEGEKALLGRIERMLRSFTE